MNNPTFILLYVKSTATSVAFYTALLGCPPADASPTFAMFAFPNGLKLGLWARETVQPLPHAGCGGTEIGFPADTEAQVYAVHDAWQRQGVPLAQPVTKMDFGLTFVGTDPDGHRLRVFHPQG